MSRKEKRKEVKKLKRKQLRQRQALQFQKEEEESLALDPSEVLRQQILEEQALAKEEEEHAAQEKLWLLREEQVRLETHRKQEEEAVRKLREEEWKRRQTEEVQVLEYGWEYVEDGPAEIIWQGNEIIVNKPRRKVWRGDSAASKVLEDKTRATSNPLPPQSTAFSTHQLSSATTVTDQSSNFGTEQDKRNCPFYLKTGVCRFGVRCSRMHPIFNEKACTLLMRSMYNGAGLALDDLEGLEGRWPEPKGGRLSKKQQLHYTDEEVTNEYEDFYDDVHPEFLQFGEIINFKVCRNGSPHLRGNLYVHYLSDESAMAAYNSLNGRFFAKKQITCEFVGVTKWRAAICGEYMKANYEPCSHGTACNFMHVFRNPRGEYDWADWDKAPPWHWQKKMARMFGRAQDSDEGNKKRRRDEDWKEGACEDDNYYSWRGMSLPGNHRRRSRDHSSRKSRSVDRYRMSRSQDRHQISRHRKSTSQDRHRRSRSRDRHHRSRSRDRHHRSRSRDRHHRLRSRDRHRRSRSLEHHIPRSSSQARLHSSSDEREDWVKNGYEKEGSPSLVGSRSQSRSRYGQERPRRQSRRHSAQRLNSRERYHSGSDDADHSVTTGYTSGEGSRTPTGGDGKRHSGLGSHDSDNGETTRGYSHSIEWRGDYDKAGRCHDRYFSQDPKNSGNREHHTRRKCVHNPEEPCSRSFADGRWKMNGDALLGERGTFALKESSSTDLKFERDPNVEDGLKDGEQLHVATTNGDGLERFLETGVSMALNGDAVQESTVRWLKWKHSKPKTTRQATCEAFLE